MDPPPDPPPGADEVTNYNEDPLKFIKEIAIGDGGMKIDRDLYRSFQTVVTDDSAIRNFVENMEFESAETYLEENILDKPEEFLLLRNLENLLNSIENSVSQNCYCMHLVI